jgi:Mn-dependent DtxR family transcriptional regulator
MEEIDNKKREINITVPPEIYTNKELSISEKLLLALDYSYNSKKGYTQLSNKWVGKLLNLHQNTISKNRKSLIEKGYLEKDPTDNRKYILISEKLKTVKLPLIKGKTDKRKLILPFEIYNHPNLTEGAKLFWGDVNSFSENKDGYFQQRITAKLRFNVSKDTITNWTKELRGASLVEYQIKYDPRTGVKYRMMRTKDLIDVDFLDKTTKSIEIQDTKGIPEKIFNNKEDEYKIEPLGGLQKYSDLNINKKGEKYNYKEEDDDDYYDDENFEDEEEEDSYH